MLVPGSADLFAGCTEKHEGLWNGTFLMLSKMEGHTAWILEVDKTGQCVSVHQAGHLQLVKSLVAIARQKVLAGGGEPGHNAGKVDNQAAGQALRYVDLGSTW